jgi:hypothetical protein
MPVMKNFSAAGNLEAAQAAELALLVDLEACWENLRTRAQAPAAGQSSIQSLHNKQRAYDAFRAKLAAYNKLYKPPHTPELLLNTPARLGLWCKAMRDLYLQIVLDPNARCPSHLVEKAYRWADRLADSMGKPHVGRPGAQGTIPAAILELDVLCQWCAGLDGVAPAA